MTQEDIKTLHYALFWLKDSLSTDKCLDRTYRETSMSVSATIDALSKMALESSDLNLNSEQFKALFNDKWQHVNFIEKK